MVIAVLIVCLVRQVSVNDVTTDVKPTNTVRSHHWINHEGAGRITVTDRK